MDASMLSKVKQLEAENNRLKRMYAELQMDHDVLKEAMTKKW
jgi:putative transposase